MNFYAVLLVFISVYVADSRTYAAITCGPDDIYLTNPADCGSYYQCSNGVPYLQHCAPTHSGSLVFDPSLNVCVQPSEYDCAKSVTITKSPETTTEPPETTTELPEAPTDPPEVATQPPEITVEPTEGEAFGPCHGNSYFVNPDDCGSFFQCEDGVTNLIHCPLTHSGSLVFDPSLNVCVWPSEYDCTKSGKTTQPPDTTTDHPETTKEPPVTTTETPETTTETPETTSETPETTTEAFGLCHGHTYFVNPDDCSSFFQCADGVPHLIHCPPTHSGSLVFDPSLNVCVWPSEYDCTKSVTTTQPPETITEPPITTTEPPETTTETPEPVEATTEAFGPCHGHTYLVNPDDCRSFYQCTNGVAELIHCPSTHDGSLVFDPSLNVCVWPSEYDCTKSVTTTQPPETITEPPVTTTEPPETTTETPEPVEATTEAFGTCHGHTYLVNPDDCRSFYQCTNGVAELIHCPSTHDGSLVFDPSLNVCVWPSEYDCTKSVTTIEPPETTTEPPETTPDTFNPCHEFSHPTTCLSSPNNCSFCFDTCFRDGAVDMIRCDKYENLLKAGCHTFKLNRTEYDSVVKTSPNCSTWLPLEPGKKRKFSVTFSLEKHPLDLYYLMDFSGSMSDDKSNLITLSSGLLETLANLTDDFHIGFGTFVDKPISPFGARGDYSFHNDFPLTSETDGFVTKISDIPIKGGGDGPESHADALVQVVECSDQIGWRNNTRRVVLLATDIYFHIAGDGRRSNINDPYVDGCYLDSLGAYTEELTMDYPSVEQLANAYSKKQATTTAIFATGSSTVKFYEEVASQFKSAYVGVLKTDSSNVLELIKNEFAKIDSRMEIEKSDTTDSVSFKYFSNCMNSDDERETTICEHLPKTGEVTFVVEIDLAECPSDKDETGMKFDLNPVGLPIFIEVELSYLCD